MSISCDLFRWHRHSADPTEATPTAVISVGGCIADKLEKKGTSQISVIASGRRYGPNRWSSAARVGSRKRYLGPSAFVSSVMRANVHRPPRAVSYKVGFRGQFPRNLFRAVAAVPNDIEWAHVSHGVRVTSSTVSAVQIFNVKVN